MSQLPNCIPSPAWWQLMRWITDPIEFQRQARQKYGDVFTLRLSGLGSVVVVGSPQVIQEIFSQDAKFDIGRGNEIAKPLFGENSIVVLDGDRHRRERKLLMPPFHGERLHTYAKQICAITEQVASRWQVGQPILARSEMQQISLEVILRVVFGLSDGDRYQQIKPLLIDWLNLVDSPLRSSILFLKFLQHDWGAWSPWGKMRRRQSRIHDLLQAEIEQRRTEQTEGRSDVLSLMMAARDEEGHAMTDEQLRDELLSILFAGHETTATVLAWAFYQLHRSPEVRSKLLQELDTIGAGASPLEISQLPYLGAVCQETLRMYPVTPIVFPRITKSLMKMAGYEFGPETTLMPSIYLVHYREDLYPEPSQFRPERFLARQYSPTEFLPFGGGVRRCLGYALAMLEMKLVLATVLSRYQLALAENKPVKLQRRGLTLTPKGGVRMVVMGTRTPSKN